MSTALFAIDAVVVVALLVATLGVYGLRQWRRRGQTQPPASL